MAVEVTVIKSNAIDLNFFQQLTAAMPEWFQHGGVVMWLLLLTSFLVTIVSLERAFSWVDYLLKKEHFPLNDCLAYLNKNEKQQALLCCQKLDTPALNMLKYGINSLPFSPHQKMNAYAKNQVNLMLQGQSLLRSAVLIALLLGFLGTTFSLVDSLNTLSQQNNNSLSALLGEISHALIATAAGVSVALFAFIPYQIFKIQADKLRDHLQNISGEFSYICQQKSLITNQISEIMALQEERLSTSLHATETVAEQSEMPYHYEFKEGSDEVNVSLHKEMKNLHKTSQSSLIDMYKDELNKAPKKKKKKHDVNAPSSLFEVHQNAVNEKQELYGVDEVKLQEQQEIASIERAKYL